MVEKRAVLFASRLGPLRVPCVQLSAALNLTGPDRAHIDCIGGAGVWIPAAGRRVLASFHLLAHHAPHRRAAHRLGPAPPC